MKILLLTTLLTLTSFIYSQDSFDEFTRPFVNGSSKVIWVNPPSVPSYGEPDMPVGLAMMIGGATFITAGLLTMPTHVGGSTTQKKPFFRQPKAFPILTGTAFLTVGMVISIK